MFRTILSSCLRVLGLLGEDTLGVVCVDVCGGSVRIGAVPAGITDGAERSCVAGGTEDGWDWGLGSGASSRKQLFTAWDPRGGWNLGLGSGRVSRRGGRSPKRPLGEDQWMPPLAKRSALSLKKSQKMWTLRGTRLKIFSSR